MSEKLPFSIKISGTFWDKRPNYSIILDDETVVESTINGVEPETHNFEKELSEGPHVLKIRLNNKEPSDTRLEDGKIVKDMLLNVEGIIIDDISLDHLLWESKFVPDQPRLFQGQTVDHLDGCVNLGWNGTYMLDFETPFYLWLLDKI